MRIEAPTTEQTADQFRDIVLLISLDGAILDATPAALESYGCTREELLGLSIRDIYAPQDQGSVDDHLSRAANDGIVFEATHRRRDGSVFPVEVRAAAVSAGGEKALLNLVRDTSSTKDAEAALREERALLAQAEEIAHIGCWRTLVETGVTEWSNETYRIFGLDRDTVGGDVDGAKRRAVHPDDRDRFTHPAKQGGDGDTPEPNHYRIVRPDGSVRWIEERIREERDESGGLVALQGCVQDVTERKEAETGLVERERAARALLDAITESALLMKVDGEIVAINETAAAWLGHSPEDLLGKVAYDFRPSETAAQRELAALVAETGNPVSLDDVREGRYVRNSVYPVFEDGEVAHVALFAYDVTEYEVSSAALRESRHWLNESQRVAGLGHYVFDILADEWTGSESLYDVFGIEDIGPLDFAGWLEIVHPADRDRVSRYFSEEVAGKGQPFDLEYRIIRPRDGVERWVRGLGELNFGDSGTPHTMFGVIQDVSERKRIENELERERLRLLRAETIGHVGSWHLDLSSGNHKWSSPATSVLGFDPAEVDADMTRALSSAVHPDDASSIEAFVPGILATREEVALDCRIIRPDGETRWVCLQGQMESDAAGTPASVSGVLQDITDRKQAEEVRVVDLEQAANVDRLTGLHNRRGFELIAEQSIAQAMRANFGIGLMYCDVDGLKLINDRYGHAQGDRALQDLASVMRFTLRSADAVARIGGDEFVVLALDGETDALEPLKHRLDEGLEFFNATNERPYVLAASSGSAWRAPGQQCELSELMAAADASMYVEKKRRRRLASQPGSGDGA